MSEAIDPKLFRNALGAFATGVTIVTTRGPDGVDVGLTANSFNSVSLDPPMVLWSLVNTSASLPAFMGSDYFAVHILASDQQPLSATFARKGVDKFEGLEFKRGHGGVPLLAGCAARFECRTVYRYEGGDHTIFVGEVLTFEHFPRNPLVYHAGSYAYAVARPAAPKAESQASALLSRDVLLYQLSRAHNQLFDRIGGALTAHGLEESDYYLLTVLSECDASSLAEAQAAIATTGETIDAAHLKRLVEKGLVTADGGQGRLTDEGRRVSIEVMAAVKAAEAGALDHFDEAEAALLNRLLQRLVSAT